MPWALVLLPTITGFLAFITGSDRWRRAILLLTAITHLALVASLWRQPAAIAPDAWVGIDPAAKLFLTITSVLFLAAAGYAIGYLRYESARSIRDAVEGFFFTNAPEAKFTGCLLLFLAAMTLAAVSRHLGLLWVAVEATTLASAPLIAFHRHHRSLEATWKYLLICSVGIALAMLGNYFLAAAAHRAAGVHLFVDELKSHAHLLDPVWLKAAFLFLLVGYGTKMGLAPMHNWLPDAHSEAPSVVSALLSGALLNCAFLAILRVMGVLCTAGLGFFARDLMILLGLISLGAAAVFLIAQTGFKRMLAYSSVEHMGILVLGIGLGGTSAFGALMHTMNHSLAKAMLFMASGNLLAVYGTKNVSDTKGALHRLPITGAIWTAGFLAIAGSPPFGTFLSEFLILKGALDAHRFWVAAGFLFLLSVIFIALAQNFLPMAFGRPDPGTQTASRRAKEPLWSVLPPAFLGVLVLLSGLYIPRPLSDVFHQAIDALGLVP